MVTFPISSYFLSLWYLFDGMLRSLHFSASSFASNLVLGSQSFRICVLRVRQIANSTFRKFPGVAFFPACIAAVVANLVLIGYIIVAVEEDQGDQAALAAAKKAREERKAR